ncbi:TPA: BppU family phage baseplate upper protein, partial [Staphylococcus aureus]|nr:BppU family phage baseplate upper protein [Staphylococcus aureus]
SNGTRYNIEGLSVIFEGIKPDGTRIIDKSGATILDAKNGEFRYVFPRQAFSADGEYEQAFFKLMRDEQADSTLEFKIKIKKNKVELNINSTDYITEVEQLIAKLKHDFDAFVSEKLNIIEPLETKINAYFDAADAIQKSINALNQVALTKQWINVEEFNEYKNTVINDRVHAIQDLETKFQQLKNSMNIYTENDEHGMSFIDGYNHAYTSLKSMQLSHQKKLVALENLINSTSRSGLQVNSNVLDDVNNIRESGIYWFDSSTRNIPVRNGNNSNGYIEAIMKDPDNGMFTILGADISIEKWQGQLHQRWRSSQPILLWEGTAKKGSVMELRDNIHNYMKLIINISFYTDKNATRFVSVPANNERIYLNQSGLRLTQGNLKNGNLEEIGILVQDDTHLNLYKTQMATDNENAVDSEAAITAVYGIY